MITFPGTCHRRMLPHLPVRRSRFRLHRLRRKTPARPAAAFGALQALAILLAASQASAQMPGLPVLQNVFAYPAIAVAANVGYAEDALTLGGAATWVPSGGRYVVSGAAGIVSPEEGDENAFAVGLRVAAPLRTFLDEALGVAAFAGAGGAWLESFDELGAVAGVAAGWRRTFGVGRGVSLHTAPHARWVRNSLADGSSSSAWLLRVSAGVDMTVTASIGATIGFETGSTDDAAAPLVARSVVGAGLSYVFR